MANRFEKSITFCGQPARVACDGLCSNAWGANSRPRIMLGDHPDDYAFLSDAEAGPAPADPGTTEGGQRKPAIATGPEHMNKWCVRECERSVMTDPRDLDGPLILRDFSRRVFNRRSVDLTPRDREMIDRALGVWLSDYTEAPEEEVAALRALIFGKLESVH